MALFKQAHLCTVIKIITGNINVLDTNFKLQCFVQSEKDNFIFKKKNWLIKSIITHTGKILQSVSNLNPLTSGNKTIVDYNGLY